MRYYIFLSFLCLLTFFACKSKEKIADSSQKNTPEPKNQGKISHEYKSAGCSTVIVVNGTVLDAPLILIPKDQLPSDLDQDGLEISFDYRSLKMPNPPGCDRGIPAEIKNIKKRKK